MKISKKQKSELIDYINELVAGNWQERSPEAKNSYYAIIMAVLESYSKSHKNLIPLFKGEV